MRRRRITPKTISDLTLSIRGLAKKIAGRRNINTILKGLDHMEKLIMSTSTQVIADLKKANERLRKLIKDTSGLQPAVDELKAKIKELEERIGGGGTIDQELVALARETVELAQVVDDNVPELPGVPAGPVVLSAAQLDALDDAGLPLTSEQIDANTAGTGPTLTAEQVAALAAAGVPVS